MASGKTTINVTTFFSTKTLLNQAFVINCKTNHTTTEGRTLKHLGLTTSLGDHASHIMVLIKLIVGFWLKAPNGSANLHFLNSKTQISFSVYFLLSRPSLPYLTTPTSAIMPDLQDGQPQLSLLPAVITNEWTLKI